jgi:hypothetical protein
VAAIQIACRSAFARPCCDFGSAFRTLPILWNLFRHRNKFHYADVRIMPKSGCNTRLLAANALRVSA